MAEANDKVRPLRAATAADETSCPAQAGQRRDLARASMFLALLAIILLGILFFALERNMTGLARETAEARQAAELASLGSGTVEDLAQELDSLTNRLTVLSNRLSTASAHLEDVEALAAALDGSVAGMNLRVAAMENGVAGLEERLALLEGLPEEARSMVRAALLDDLAGRAAALAAEAGPGSDQDRLLEAMQIILDVRRGIEP